MWRFEKAWRAIDHSIVSWSNWIKDRASDIANAWKDAIKYVWKQAERAKSYLNSAVEQWVQVLWNRYKEFKNLVETAWNYWLRLAYVIIWAWKLVSEATYNKVSWTLKLTLKTWENVVINIKNTAIRSEAEWKAVFDNARASVNSRNNLSRSI